MRKLMWLLSVVRPQLGYGGKHKLLCVVMVTFRACGSSLTVLGLQHDITPPMRSQILHRIATAKRGRENIFFRQNLCESVRYQTISLSDDLYARISPHRPLCSILSNRPKYRLFF